VFEARVINLCDRNIATLSEAGYDEIIEWARSILPEGKKLKENFYAAKSMMKPFGLGY
jgi:hypothetical protein